MLDDNEAWDRYFAERREINERFTHELRHSSVRQDYLLGAISFIATVSLVLLLQWGS